jgi:hypothetical protein
VEGLDHDRRDLRNVAWALLLGGQNDGEIRLVGRKMARRERRDHLLVTLLLGEVDAGRCPGCDQRGVVVKLTRAQHGNDLGGDRFCILLPLAQFRRGRSAVASCGRDVDCQHSGIGRVDVDGGGLAEPEGGFPAAGNSESASLLGPKGAGRRRRVPEIDGVGDVVIVSDGGS